jgi:ssDNA-specific exonuclease RecJ
MDLNILESELDELILSLRSVQYLVKSDEFRRIYSNAKNDEKVYIKSLAMRGNRKEIFKWLNKKKPKELEEMPTSELRKIAVSLGIRYSYRYIKYELIERIKDARRIIAQN